MKTNRTKILKEVTELINRCKWFCFYKQWHMLDIYLDKGYENKTEKKKEGESLTLKPPDNSQILTAN